MSKWGVGLGLTAHPFEAARYPSHREAQDTDEYGWDKPNKYRDTKCGKASFRCNGLENADVFAPHELCLLRLCIASDLKLIAVGHLKNERVLLPLRAFLKAQNILREFTGIFGCASAIGCD